ncbi:MAG TPA: hypothetical protein VF984_07110, partial [Actinomycetota bacterium]
ESLDQDQYALHPCPSPSVTSASLTVRLETITRPDDPQRDDLPESGPNLDPSGLVRIHPPDLDPVRLLRRRHREAPELDRDGARSLDGLLPHEHLLRIDQTLSVVGRWALTFEGNGVTFKAVTQGDKSRRHLKFRDGGDPTIRDMTVVGANPNAGMRDSAWNANFAAQHAYSFYGVQGAVLDHVRAYDV